VIKSVTLKTLQSFRRTIGESELQLDSTESVSHDPDFAYLMSELLAGLQSVKSEIKEKTQIPAEDKPEVIKESKDLALVANSKEKKFNNRDISKSGEDEKGNIDKNRNNNYEAVDNKSSKTEVKSDKIVKTENDTTKNTFENTEIESSEKIDSIINPTQQTLAYNTLSTPENAINNEVSKNEITSNKGVAISEGLINSSTEDLKLEESLIIKNLETYEKSEKSEIPKDISEEIVEKTNLDLATQFNEIETSEINKAKEPSNENINNVNSQEQIIQVSNEITSEYNIPSLNEEQKFEEDSYKLSDLKLEEIFQYDNFSNQKLLNKVSEATYKNQQKSLDFSLTAFFENIKTTQEVKVNQDNNKIVLPTNVNTVSPITIDSKGVTTQIKPEPSKVKQTLDLNKNTAKIIDKIHELAEEVNRSKDGKSISMRLDPPELGKIKVDIRYDDGQLYARVMADNPEVTEWLRGKEQDIIQYLKKSGVQFEQISFSFDERSNNPKNESGFNSTFKNENLFYQALHLNETVDYTTESERYSHWVA
jgi:flagellar hook-length control protein FliK